MFKTSLSRLAQLLDSSNHYGSRVAIALSMLKGELDDEPRRATVLLLNSEKEILPEEEMV